MVGLSTEGDLDLLPMGESATGVGVPWGGCCADCEDTGVALLSFANSSLVGFRAQIRRLEQGQSGHLSMLCSNLRHDVNVMGRVFHFSSSLCDKNLNFLFRPRLGSAVSCEQIHGPPLHTGLPHC